MNISDALRRAIRTLMVLVVAAIPGVPGFAALFGVPAGRVAQIVGALTFLVTLLTALQNHAEDKGTIPALLKAPPSPGVNPVPDDEPTAGIVTRLIDETEVEGRRLGRHVLHDARSLGFLARELINRNAPVTTKLWPFPGKPLDQKATGSCTGNATTHLLRVRAGKVGKLNEVTARKVYSLATHLDATPGVWPPTDTGSDGLSALKAAQQLGLFTGTYRWCLGLDDVLAVLSQHGPVIIGIPWYQGFDNPAKDGTVTISGEVRGGHEVCVIGVNAEAKTVQLVNSWGSSYALGGHFQMTWDTLDRLLHEQGDAATVA